MEEVCSFGGVACPPLGTLSGLHSGMPRLGHGVLRPVHLRGGGHPALWNISVSIPLQMLGVGAAAIPYAVLLYMPPLVYGLTKRWVYPAKERNKKE